MDNNLKVIILAAGKGTRMKSDLPKVVHKCMGSSMVHHVIEASKKAGAGAICAIVGYKADEVKNVIKAENAADIENGGVTAQETVKEAVKEEASKVEEAVQEKVAETKEKVSDKVEEVKEKVEATEKVVEEKASEVVKNATKETTKK